MPIVLTLHFGRYTVTIRISKRKSNNRHSAK